MGHENRNKIGVALRVLHGWCSGFAARRRQRADRVHDNPGVRRQLRGHRKPVQDHRAEPGLSDRTLQRRHQLRRHHVTAAGNSPKQLRDRRREDWNHQHGRSGHSRLYPGVAGFCCLGEEDFLLRSRGNQHRRQRCTTVLPDRWDARGCSRSGHGQRQPGAGRHQRTRRRRRPHPCFHNRRCQPIAGSHWHSCGAAPPPLFTTTADVTNLPKATGNPAAPIGSAYSKAYNAQMQAALADIARSGVRVELIDVALLGSLIKANPSRYGVANVGACPLTCIGNPSLQNQYLFYFDGIHLTSLGFTIMGEYIVNRLEAPLTLPAQADLGMSSAMGFASTLFGKLDNFREMSLMSSAMNSYAAYTKVPYVKAPIPAPVNPWSFYMLGNGAYSDRQATVASNGFNLDSVGGTAGIEYRINNNAFIGGAFDYSNPKARFFNNGGTTEAHAYQIGDYGPCTQP